MSATVNATANASAKIVGEIVNIAMKDVPGTYTVTLRYGEEPQTTAQYTVTVDDKFQINLTSAVSIGQLGPFEIVSVVKTV